MFLPRRNELMKRFDFMQNTRCVRIKGFIKIKGGARGVMVIIVGHGHGDTSSNPGRD